MPIDVTTPQSPGWWLVRLTNRLMAERPEVDRLNRYFTGDHPLPEGADGMRDAYRQFQRLSRSNYLSLVVEAPLERMRVVGFRTGSSGTDAGDDATWSLWQKARLDADQVQVHRTMLALRRAYVIVGPHPRKRGEVLITPEHPSQVTVESYPDDPRTARAALKMYADDVTGRTRATVYLPNWIIRFESDGKAGDMDNSTLFTPSALSRWNIVGEPQANPYGVVPVVEFANRTSILGQARAEFEDVLDIQNRINTTLLHRLVSEKFGAFRQKAILNLDFDEDEEGEAIVPRLSSNPAEAWLLQGENLRLEEFSQNETSGILKAVESDIRDLAAISLTPAHYLLANVGNMGGDTLKASETGLVAKVRERSSQAGESWEQVMALAHLIKGNREAALSDMEAIWADPESRTLGELYDAAVKAQSAGVPWKARMVLLGYSPQQIKRMESERTQDAMLAALMAPAAPAAPVAAPGAPAEAVAAPAQGPNTQEA